jgi:hypothetical protein
MTPSSGGFFALQRPLSLGEKHTDYVTILQQQQHLATILHNLYASLRVTKVFEVQKNPPEDGVMTHRNMSG